MQKYLFIFFLVLGILLVSGGCIPATGEIPITETITETATAALPTASALPVPGSDTPTSEPRPTLDVYSLAPLTPTLTPNPSIRPSRTPTPTKTPRPVRPAIQILYPGPDSKVADEVELRAYVQPGKDRYIRTRLIGEDGRVIFERVAIYKIEPDVWGYIVVRIPFTLPLAGEFCRLQVETRDEFNRIVAVDSVHVLVLTGGYSELTPSDDTRPRTRVGNPRPGDEVIGGQMLVEGDFRPINDQPLIIALLDEDGNILASHMVPITGSSTGQEAPFSAELSYAVTEPVLARLTLYQEDNRIPGIMYLYSQEVLLEP